jgi:hypothetical protein
VNRNSLNIIRHEKMSPLDYIDTVDNQQQEQESTPFEDDEVE